MPQDAQQFQKSYTHTKVLQYLQYLPPAVSQDPTQRWPMILFLHGGGERGDNLDLVKVHGIPRIVETQDLPFITISPQCPANRWWGDYLYALEDLVEQAINILPVDPDRIYLTGMSMGGYGTWHLAVDYPQRFAAIAPICGGGHWSHEVYERILNIRHLPVWAFHGSRDRVVLPSESRELVKALKKGGGNARLTIYPGVGHDSWTQTYANPALYEWFLSHKRGA